MKKWLSYREFELLGRALSLDEIKEVGAMARRLATLVLLQPVLDDNYRIVSAATYPWPDIAVRARLAELTLGESDIDDALAWAWNPLAAPQAE